MSRAGSQELQRLSHGSEGKVLPHIGSPDIRRPMAMAYSNDAAECLSATEQMNDKGVARGNRARAVLH